ncbi:MAG: cell division FtsA domain-containing protein [Burkholderiaceae bacterium]
MLTDDEKELGVALVDIGGGTTDIAIFTGGAIRHTAVIPIAGDQITNDIAMALRTPTPEADEIKLRHGIAKQVLAEGGDRIEGARPGRSRAANLVAPGTGGRDRAARRGIVRAGATGDPRIGLRGTALVRNRAHRRDQPAARHGGSGRGHLPEAGPHRPAGLSGRAGRRGALTALPATAVGLLEEARAQHLRGRKVAEQSGSFRDTMRRMRDWFLGNF